MRVFGALQDFAQIETGAEVLARPADEQHANRGIVRGALQSFAQGGHHLAGDRVALVGAIQRDAGYAARRGVLNQTSISMRSSAVL